MSREWMGPTRFVTCDIEAHEEAQRPDGHVNPLRVSRQRWPEGTDLPEGWEELGIAPVGEAGAGMLAHACPLCRTSDTALLWRALLDTPNQDPRQQGESPDGG